MRIYLLIFSIFIMAGRSYAQPADAILGNWSSVRRNVNVQVYREGNEFKGRVTWFKDTDDKSKPMLTRTDENNPNPKLRIRKILGLQVLSRLRYNTKTKRWEAGKIYDPKTGKTWSAVAYLDEAEILNVKGFWQFEFIGRTMKFERMSK